MSDLHNSTEAIRAVLQDVRDRRGAMQERPPTLFEGFLEGYAETHGVDYMAFRAKALAAANRYLPLDEGPPPLSMLEWNELFARFDRTFPATDRRSGPLITREAFENLFQAAPARYELPEDMFLKCHADRFVVVRNVEVPDGTLSLDIAGHFGRLPPVHASVYLRDGTGRSHAIVSLNNIFLNLGPIYPVTAEDLLTRVKDYTQDFEVVLGYVDRVSSTP